MSIDSATDTLTDPSRAPSALEAMTGVLDFFSTFGVQHNDDEEKTLFPRLRPLPAFVQTLDAFDFQHHMAETQRSTLAGA